MTSMRTTIRIDDELYRRVKQRAAATGRSVSAVLEDAVRRGMVDDRPTDGELPELVTARGDGLMPGVDLTSNASLRETMDGAEPLDALR